MRQKYWLLGMAAIAFLLAINGCDVFDDYETYDPDTPNTCMIYPNLDWVDECEYLVTIAISENCADQVDYYRWQWMSWGWQYEKTENGSVSFTMDFQEPAVYRLDAIAYNQSGAEIATFFDGFEVDCGGQSQADLNLTVTHDPSGGCDDVLIRWNNTDAEFYELYVDGIFEGTIPGSSVPQFVYGYEQLSEVVEYTVMDSKGNTDSFTFDRECD